MAGTMLASSRMQYYLSCVGPSVVTRQYERHEGNQMDSSLVSALILIREYLMARLVRGR